MSGTALYRVAGFTPLAVAGVLDVAKGAVGPLLAGRDRPVLAAVAGGAAVAGHNWSPWLRGRAGAARARARARCWRPRPWASPCWPRGSSPVAWPRARPGSARSSRSPRSCPCSPARLARRGAVAGVVHRGADGGEAPGRQPAGCHGAAAAARTCAAFCSTTTARPREGAAASQGFPVAAHRPGRLRPRRLDGHVRPDGARAAAIGLVDRGRRHPRAAPHPRRDRRARSPPGSRNAGTGGARCSPWTSCAPASSSWSRSSARSGGSTCGRSCSSSPASRSCPRATRRSPTWRATTCRSRTAWCWARRTAPSRWGPPPSRSAAALTHVDIGIPAAWSANFALAFWIDAATFLISFAFVRRIADLAGPRRVPTTVPAESGLARPRTFTAALRIPLIRAVMPATLTAAARRRRALLARHRVRARPARAPPTREFGAMIALFGVGAAGGLGLLSRRRDADLLATVRTGVAAQGAVIVVFSLAPSLAGAFLGAVGFGASAAFTLAAGMSALQSRLEGDERVLAFTVFHVVIRAGLSLAALGAGIAADLVGGVRLAARRSPRARAARAVLRRRARLRQLRASSARVRAPSNRAKGGVACPSPSSLTARRRFPPTWRRATTSRSCRCRSPSAGSPTTTATSAWPSCCRASTRA